MTNPNHAPKTKKKGHTKYYAGGKRCPSVTTIIGGFKESAALQNWAWKCGLDGIDFRKVRDDAAAAGTLGHKMIERDIRGDRDPWGVRGPDQQTEFRAHQAYENYLDWKKQHNLRFLMVEVQLVCEKYKFGGTIDAIGFEDVTLIAWDWKTSKDLYSDHLAQLAAYQYLWEHGELNKNAKVSDTARKYLGQKPEHGRIIRFDKSTAKTNDYYFSQDELHTGWEYFLALRLAYEHRKTMNKVVNRLRKEHADDAAA